MLFSIITPCFNSEGWIRRCINSVAAGNDQIEYEHIIIDDGSTDQTLPICLSMANDDPHIKVIHRENRGYCETMNELISLCIGDYVISVDSDNWLSEGALKILKNEVMRTKADYYQFPIVHIDTHGNIISRPPPDAHGEYLDRPSIEKGVYNKEIGIKTHGGKLISRSLFVSGVLFSGDPVGADGRLAQKVVYLSKSVITLNRPLLYFECRDDSLGNTEWGTPLLWARHVAEELAGIGFYKAHLNAQTLPIAELASTYDIYINSLMEQDYVYSLDRHNGRLIWQNRSLLLPKSAYKRVRCFFACYFPGLSRFWLCRIKRRRTVE